MANLGEERADLTACLLAGRRAALASIYELAENSGGLLVYGGPKPEEMSVPILNFNGVDVMPVIDAVVIETMVRLEHPDRVKATPRPWWKFWR